MSVQNKQLYFCDFCGREQLNAEAFKGVTPYRLVRSVGCVGLNFDLDVCKECQEALVVFIASLKAGGAAHG
jgi:anaerobic ribonucleoside-triphosphate reductase